MDIEKLMKKCQIGCGGKDALANAHDILAECYGTIGLLNKDSVAFNYMADMWISMYFTNGPMCHDCENFMFASLGPGLSYCKVLEDGLDVNGCPALEDYIEPAFKLDQPR